MDMDIYKSKYGLGQRIIMWAKYKNKGDQSE